MDIMKFIEEKLEDPEILNKLSGSSNADSEKVKKVAKLSVPAMVKALAVNAQSEDGRNSLENALDDHKEDDIADIKKYLNNVNKDEGEKVLSHMFGSNKDKIKTNISRESGLGEDHTSNILKQLAPLLLGVLGQKKKNEKLGSSGISGLLGDILSGSDSGIMGTVTNLLDKDGDGSIVDDVSDIAGKFFKNKS